MARTWRLLLPQFTHLIVGTTAEALVTQAYKRLESALIPRTATAYLSKLKLFLSFVSWFQFPLVHVDTLLALSSPQKMVPPLLPLQVMYPPCVITSKSFFFDLAPLNHRKIHLFIKSVGINAPYTPKYKANFTIPILLRLVKACDKFPLGFIYKADFLLAYFGFLRLSNIAPTSSNSFDSSLHFLRSDIIFGPPGAHVIVKWAKAMQGSTKHQVIQIPSLPSSPICPVSALKCILQPSHASSSAPCSFPPLHPLFLCLHP